MNLSDEIMIPAKVLEYSCTKKLKGKELFVLHYCAICKEINSCKKDSAKKWRESKKIINQTITSMKDKELFDKYYEQQIGELKKITKQMKKGGF